MKKLLFILGICFALTSFAQTPQQPATSKPAATTTTHTKKDGTPDKRYKENKQAPPQHVKKDGTPDKRYKENKKPS